MKALRIFNGCDTTWYVYNKIENKITDYCEPNFLEMLAKPHQEEYILKRIWEDTEGLLMRLIDKFEETFLANDYEKALVYFEFLWEEGPFL